jgi:hypothetical protein
MKTNRKSIASKSRLLLAFILVPLFINAQQVKYGQTFPTTSVPFGISVIHDGRSKMVLPVGTYRIPNSSYFFFAPSQSPVMFGVVGGLVGAIAEEAYLTTKMKKLAKEEALIASINLDTITAHFLSSKLQAHPSLLMIRERTKNILTVRTSSWVVIKKDNYEMSIEVEAIYLNETGAKKWKGLYGYTLPDNKPLFGEASLTADSATILKQRVNEGIEKCIDALLMDLKGTEAQWKNDPNLPTEISELPKNKGNILIQETNDDWLIKQPITKKSHVIKIISKNPERLLPHRIEK